MYECDWWNTHKTDNNVKQHLRESFHYRKPLREEKVLEFVKSGCLFGYVQCDFEVIENLREHFSIFLPIFNSIIVGRDDISPYTGEYAEKEGLLTHPTRMLISSSSLENGTIITLLFPFCLDFGRV